MTIKKILIIGLILTGSIAAMAEDTPKSYYNPVTSGDRKSVV